MTRRFGWFDCLRFVAVLFVILAHCATVAKRFPSPIGTAFIDVASVSWTGVDLFFVLSGFLVSGLLFDEYDATGRLDLRRFLIRRGFKIVPSFYFLVMVTAVVDLARRKFNLEHFIHDILFIQSYRSGAWAHAWTLAVEVHFYILLGLLLYYLARRVPAGSPWLKKLPAILGAVMIGCLLARLVHSLLHHGRFSYEKELEPSHLHLDVLAAGVLLRYLYNYHPGSLAFMQRAKPFWVVLGVLLILPSHYIWLPHPALLPAWVPTSDALGYSLLLFQATWIPFPKGGLAHRLIQPFDYLGKHSYSIYLWHLPIEAWIIQPWLHDQAAAFVIFFLGLSLAVGTFFSLVLEMPVLHLRNRLLPSKARPFSIAVGPATIVETPPEEAPG